MAHNGAPYGIRTRVLALRVVPAAVPDSTKNNVALRRELIEFPSSEHDDQVDAVGLFGRRYPVLTSPDPPVQTITDPYAGMMVRPGAVGLP
jgi:hypothetical protein